MQIKAPWLIDPAAQQVCAMLTDGGHQAYFVGGCVRNALLDAAANDIDISTDARPDEVMALARAAGLKSVPTGIDHGTVTVVAGDGAFEVTTFRRDVETDGRRAVVAFADDIAEDARRRDFTINALYAAPDGAVVDPLGGLDDLKDRRIRFIEDADARIQEDYLRILRFFRFTAWYGDPAAGIEAEGLAACAANLDGLERLSAERVGQEMIKLLSAPDPAPALAAMKACGALLRLLPGAAADFLTVVVHVEQEAGFAPDPIRRLAALGVDGTADRLRLSNAQAAALVILADPAPSIEIAYRHGERLGLDHAILAAAAFNRTLTPDEIDRIKDAARQTFPLSAADLMPALQGRALGDALKSAEARWIASGFTLTKADLLA